MEDYGFFFILSYSVPWIWLCYLSALLLNQESFIDSCILSMASCIILSVYSQMGPEYLLC